VHWQRLVRLAFAVLTAIAVLVPQTTAPVTAETGDRTLYLYHTHTHETARITFKRNGVFDPKGLQQLDWFLRDFRNNQPTEMAPQLFDLVWEIYQKSGATQPINIVSAYRSPATNAYLHARSSGVANNSQHMLGHAMDWFVPGVPLTKLRAIAMQQQVGGVGFYPTSASPFVHTDVGTVRAWPRMTQAQLQSIFPDGKTMHVPTNGQVLSQSGYAYAQAQWNQCHAVPCTNAAALKGGSQSMGFTNMVALATTSMTGKTFADIHRGVNPGAPNLKDPGGISTTPDTAQQATISGSDTDENDDTDVTAGPSQTAVATIAVSAPVPLDRPAGLDEGLQVASADTSADTPTSGRGDTLMAAAAKVSFDKLFPDAYPQGSTMPAAAAVAAAAAAASSPASAPIPARKSHDLMVATGELPAVRRPQSALGAIASVEAPTAGLRLGSDDVALAAYAPIGRGTSAEQQIQALIENETTGAIIPSAGGTALTNSMRTPIGDAALKSYAADRRNTQQLPASVVASIAPVKSFTARDTHFVAPDYAANLVTPAAVSSGSFAVFSEPAATDLSPATELGPMVVRLGFHGQGSGNLPVTRFGPASPLVVASR